MKRHGVYVAVVGGCCKVFGAFVQVSGRNVWPSYAVAIQCKILRRIAGSKKPVVTQLRLCFGPEKGRQWLYQPQAVCYRDGRLQCVLLRGLYPVRGLFNSPRAGYLA